MECSEERAKTTDSYLTHMIVDYALVSNLYSGALARAKREAAEHHG